MRVEKINNGIIVYLPNINSNQELINKSNIGEYIKKLLLKINKIYKLPFNMYTNAKIYLNKEYGTICEFFDDDNVFSNLFDIKINIYYDCLFLYKLDTILEEDSELYSYKNNLYTDCLLQLRNCEFLEVKYGKEVKDIINKGIKIK